MKVNILSKLSADDIPKVRKLFWQKVKVGTPDECWPYVGPTTKRGYCAFWFKPYRRLSHRVAWEITFGAIPGLLLVLHKCDNRRCCNPSHLFLGTDQTNADDKCSKGRQYRMVGEGHPGHKLTQAQVVEIRNAYASGVSGNVLAQSYGLSEPYVFKVISGGTWKDAGGPIVPPVKFTKPRKQPKRLTQQEVEQIRQIVESGELNQTETAKRFGVLQCHVSRIVRGLSH